VNEDDRKTLQAEFDEALRFCSRDFWPRGPRGYRVLGHVIIRRSWVHRAMRLRALLQAASASSRTGA